MAKYFGFPVLAYNDFVVGVEKLEDMTEEFRQLNEEECQLTEACWLSFPIKIDYLSYLRWNRNNTFIIFTIRKEGVLVGNILYFIRPQPNMSGVLGATDNGIYIKPEYRKGRIAYKAMEFAESCLRQVGVKYIVHGDKAPSGGQDLSRFFGKLGYRPFSTLYVKELEPGDDHAMA